VPTERKHSSMTSSPEVVNWRKNVTWFKDGGGVHHQDFAWLLCFTVTFLVGLIANVAVAYTAARWSLLSTRPQGGVY